MPEHRPIRSADEVLHLAGEALYVFELEDGTEVLFATTDEDDLSKRALRGEIGPKRFVRTRCERFAFRGPGW